MFQFYPEQMIIKSYYKSNESRVQAERAEVQKMNLNPANMPLISLTQDISIPYYKCLLGMKFYPRNIIY